MAKLTTRDITKRDNCQVLADIICGRGELQLEDHLGKRVTVERALRLDGTDVPCDCASAVAAALREYCTVPRGCPPAVRVGGEWLSITVFYKDARFLPPSREHSGVVRDKAFQQRQEKSLVDRINEACKPHPIKLDKVPGYVLGAYQAPDFGPHGRENLVDVVIQCEDAEWNVSCKIGEAADLGGGGMAGLTKIVPEIVDRLYERVCDDITRAGLRNGSTYHIRDVPGLVYKIPESVTYTIFRGSEQIGGTIDYMYIGPQKVTFIEGKLNGALYTTHEYANKRPYYFRLRKRDVFDNHVTVNFDKKTRHGYPVLFTTGPTQSNAARFVVDATPAASLKKREL